MMCVSVLHNDWKQCYMMENNGVIRGKMFKLKSRCRENGVNLIKYLKIENSIDDAEFLTKMFIMKASRTFYTWNPFQSHFQTFLPRLSSVATDKISIYFFGSQPVNPH